MRKWTLPQWRKLPMAVRQPLLTKTLQEAHRLWAENPEIAPSILPGTTLRWFPPRDMDVLTLDRDTQWRVYQTTRRFTMGLKHKLDEQSKEVS